MVREQWPALPYEEWRATRDTLHMYTQVLGKLRLALSPFEPQWANVALYVTARGLTTSTIPVGHGAIDAELDLLDHALVLRSSSGERERRPLGASVADFYADTMSALGRLGVEVTLSVLPSEVAHAIPFPEDHTHATYNAAQASRFFQVLSMVDLVMKQHRAGFRGRTPPVQFWWGTFDLSVARFSGRLLTPPPDSGVIRRFGGDAEEICAGWWPGDERVRYPAFYAYAYPNPDGLERASVDPEGAAWSDLGEFVLPYDSVRSSADPSRAILDFAGSTWAAAARLMKWDGHLTDVEGPHPPASSVGGGGA